MDILRFEQLPNGGFAGLVERQFVTDERLFKNRKNPATFNGIGNFVYLADANFAPNGETGMHDHREIDVISVMVSGRISHEGSLENGQSLEAGFVQVQRAGGAGFSHNEINPDSSVNQMIQLWVLPDETGQPAGYKIYEPVTGELTHVYGGSKDQDQTFYSKTSISVANAKAGQNFAHQGAVMAYLSSGHGVINGEKIDARTLLRGETGIEFEAASDAQLILIYKL